MGSEHPRIFGRKKPVGSFSTRDQNGATKRNQGEEALRRSRDDKHVLWTTGLELVNTSMVDVGPRLATVCDLL